MKKTAPFISPHLRKRWLKTLLIMKFTALLILITALQVSAKTYSQERISVNFNHTNLSKALKTIERESSYRFVFSNDVLSDKLKVTIKAKDILVKDLLAQMLTSTDLVYTEMGNNLVGIKYSDAYYADKIIIKGTVTDGKGNPLPNVSVTAGKGAGTTTNDKGEYTISEDEDVSLTFSFVGFTSETVKVDKRGVINVVLEEGNNQLSDVVVVGYGTQKKVDLTGSIATVGSEKLDSRPLVNLGDGLEGLIPNLNVNLGNGQPGTGATYNVRGYTTINGNSSSAPLILVDGVQRDPNLIDPNDVASVTVLKDAASAAIYGGRAAYGVILITTKDGKKGKTQISYSGNYTTSRPTNLPEYVNSDGFLKLFNTAQRTGILTGGYTSSSPFTDLDSTMAAAYRADPAHNPDAYPDPGNPILYRYVGNTDWVKVLYPGWAPQQEHHLSVSGGEGKTTYSANLG